MDYLATFSPRVAYFRILFFSCNTYSPRPIISGGVFYFCWRGEYHIHLSIHN